MPPSFLFYPAIGGGAVPPRLRQWNLRRSLRLIFFLQMYGKRTRLTELPRPYALDTVAAAVIGQATLLASPQ